MPAIPTKIYHLQMCDPQVFRPAAESPGFTVDCVAPPDAELNRRFYREVGSSWNWTGRLSWTAADWQGYVQRPALATWIGQRQGEAVGYFELETQADGNVEIVYLGLLPPFIGQGLGGALLSAAIQHAWETPNTRRVWVHTCTHDHEHALDNYRRRGFELFKTEEEGTAS